MRALCTIAYEHEAHTLVCQMASRGDQRVASAVETKVARVNQDKRKISANGANNGGIEDRKGRARRENIGSVPKEHYASRNHALGVDSCAHVLPEYGPTPRA